MPRFGMTFQMAPQPIERLKVPGSRVTIRQEPPQPETSFPSLRTGDPSRKGRIGCAPIPNSERPRLPGQEDPRDEDGAENTGAPLFPSLRVPIKKQPLRRLNPRHRNLDTPPQFFAQSISGQVDDRGDFGGRFRTKDVHRVSLTFAQEAR